MSDITRDLRPLTDLEKQAAQSLIRRLQAAEARVNSYRERMALAEAERDALQAGLQALTVVMHGESGSSFQADFERGVLTRTYDLNEFTEEEDEDVSDE